MTAVSLINPYAPQPAGTSATEAMYAAMQASMPLASSSGTSNAGLASDQSGYGAGNGTGTGGAQLTSLLKRGRKDMALQQPTPKSVVEAQSESDPATEFLARQARRQAEARAAEEQRLAQQAAERAAEAKAAALEAAMPEYEMPNPLPTAPILERD